MSIDKNYFEKFIKVTEKAAIGAYPFIGKGDNNLILNVASMEHDINEVDRKDLNELKFDWKLV